MGERYYQGSPVTPSERLEAPHDGCVKSLEPVYKIYLAIVKRCEPSSSRKEAQEFGPFVIGKLTS